MIPAQTNHHDEPPEPAPAAEVKDQSQKGMTGEDYNYGGAGGSPAGKDTKKGPKNIRKEPAGPSTNPPGNTSSTEENWGKRSGTAGEGPSSEELKEQQPPESGRK